MNLNSVLSMVLEKPVWCGSANVGLAILQPRHQRLELNQRSTSPVQQRLAVDQFAASSQANIRYKSMESAHIET